MMERIPRMLEKKGRKEAEKWPRIMLIIDL